MSHTYPKTAVGYRYDRPSGGHDEPIMITRSEGPTSAELANVRRELAGRARELASWNAGAFHFSLRCGKHDLWIVFDNPDAQPVAQRVIHDDAGRIRIHRIAKNGPGLLVDASSQTGAFRVAIESGVANGLSTLHSRTTFIPTRDLLPSAQPRDLVALETQGATPQVNGELYDKQHGMQTGALFAACSGRRGASLFYLQNFTALEAYFRDTRTTPKDAVGGKWPEIGFSLPPSEDRPLLASNEYVLSDAYVVLAARAPRDEGDAARAYLDGMAQVVRMLRPPERTYRDWPKRALATVYDLSLSPECVMHARGRRYLAPYVNSKKKPPESMVQLTVLVNLLEFERWLGRTFDLTADLDATVASFFDEELGTMVRWLPGERFEEKEDEHQNHRAMDSWYLYHVLFNLARLAALDRDDARALLERSLPYAVRVARRFAYRWPIFFDLSTLDVIQAEGTKGAGGENDVSGLYALVMLHAYELFGRREYLDEAKAAAQAMEGFGFGLVYQTNTTGFSAEATFRLWKATGDRRYYDLTLVALADIFSNTALWEPRYGNAKYYSTYFGLYPLRGAPYVAAYEEAEALAKFHSLLAMAGGDLPKSVTLLAAEYAKALVSRGWGYYPGELPEDVIAPKARNGDVRRQLSVPLEDLQDGLLRSGQVGQEIYGAGLALVCVTRHFVRVPGRDFLLFCEYPIQLAGPLRYRVVGDPALSCTVRLVPGSANAKVAEDAISVRGSKRHKRTRSVEGHVLLEVRGGDELILRSSGRRRRG